MLVPPDVDRPRSKIELATLHGHVVRLPGRKRIRKIRWRTVGIALGLVVLGLALVGHL